LIADLRPRKRFSSGAVVVRRAADGWRFLLLRVYRTWDFPKGGVELGETPLQAAVREVAEETMLDDLSFFWGEDWCETAPYSGGKVARYYLAESPGQPVSLPVSAELGRPEHHEFRWLRYADARRLLPERLLPVLDWAQSLVEPDPAGQ
jgi:8-oxo-dGTP pyrophosphatase MutT (NUDIX family)